MNRLGLRVRAGAPATRVAGAYGDRVKVEVAAPPEGGRANAELLRFLEDACGASVRIVRGEASRDKEVEAEGLGAEELRRRLLGRAGS